MLYRHWIQIIGICIAMSLFGWLMLKTMRFGIRMVVHELVAVFERQTEVAQLFILLIQWGVIHLCNMIRLFVVKESVFALASRHTISLPFLTCFATVLWLAGMGYLSSLLWSQHGSLQFSMIVELLCINIGIGIMMGITLPYCTARTWLYLHRKRR